MTPPDHQSSARAQPLRMRLLLLAAIGLLPLLLVLVWGIDHLIEERRTQAEAAVLDLSRALGTAVDAELRSVATLLDHMGNTNELESADFPGFQLEARRTA